MAFHEAFSGFIFDPLKLLLKAILSPWVLASYKYFLDILNEIICVLLSPRAAKFQMVKVGGQKINWCCFLSSNFLTVY